MAEKDAEIWTLSFFRSEKVRKFELCNFLCWKKCGKLDFIILLAKKVRKVGLCHFYWRKKLGKLNFIIFNGGKRCGKLDFVIFDGGKVWKIDFAIFYG
jgi:hypothetical protein